MDRKGSGIYLALMWRIDKATRLNSNNQKYPAGILWTRFGVVLWPQGVLTPSAADNKNLRQKFWHCIDE
jgi:hypothetical protein